MDEAYTSIKYTLEKTEGSTKNGHSKDTGNIGHKTQNEDTTKKKRNTENQKDEQHEPHQQTEGEPRCSRRASRFCFL